MVVVEAGAGLTTALVAELSGVPSVPSTEAVTATWRVAPTSTSVSAYVLPVAPGTAVHPPALAEQRDHWYAYAVGLSVQVPGVAVSVWPDWAVPWMPGAAVATGTAVATSDGGLVVEPVAPFSVALSATSSVSPASVRVTA